MHSLTGSRIVSLASPLGFSRSFSVAQDDALRKMIQRIQTVYLFLGALTLGLFGVFDMPWTSTAASTHVWFQPSLIGLLIVTAGGAVGAIFLYENRHRQRFVVVGVQVGTLAITAVLYGGLYLTSELTLYSRTTVAWSRVVVLLLPIMAYGFFYFARRGIDHDIELVRSMDRIR